MLVVDLPVALSFLHVGMPASALVGCTDAGCSSLLLVVLLQPCQPAPTLAGIGIGVRAHVQQLSVVPWLCGCRVLLPVSPALECSVCVALVLVCRYGSSVGWLRLSNSKHKHHTHTLVPGTHTGSL
jgi:hypothetical protein